MSEQQRTFPLVVEHLGERLTLRAEKGRRRIVYDHNPPDAERDKKVIPETHLPGAAGEVPPPNADGMVVVPATAVLWAKAYLQLRADAKRVPEGFSVNSHTAAEPAAPVKARVPRTVATLFHAFRESEDYRGRANNAAYERSMEWFEAFLGSDYDMGLMDDDALRKLATRRQTETLVATVHGRTKRFTPLGVNTVRAEIDRVSYVFKTLRGIRAPDGDWWLADHPFDRVSLPRKVAAAAKHRIVPERAELMIRYADLIDNTGKLRCIIALSRWTGMREASLSRMLRKHLLFTAAEIEAALLRQKNRYVEEENVAEVARLYAEHGGAIYWPAEIQKMGKGLDELASVYDRVVPINPALRAELDHYLARYWNGLRLDAETAPLFPSDFDLSQPQHPDTAEKQWPKVENAIRAAGHVLRELPGTRFHGNRLQRLHEMREAAIELKERVFVVGWSTRAGAGSKAEGQLSVAEGVYARPVPALLVKAVRIGDPCTGRVPQSAESANGTPDECTSIGGSKGGRVPFVSRNGEQTDKT